MTDDYDPWEDDYDPWEDGEVIEVTVPEGWALVIECSEPSPDLDLTQWDVQYQD